MRQQAVAMLPAHVVQSAIVLDQLKLVYVPVPKAGSTAMLWALLEATELDGDAFVRSTKLETTRTLTIHDMSIWGERHRIASRAGAERRVFGSAEWLTFTIVREPVRRLWSAWVSKILLRDPRFVAAYGDEDWFPAQPKTPEDIVSSFRRFLCALPNPGEAGHDPHWSSQAALAGIGSVPYHLVGRVEELPAALEVIDAHLRARRRPGLTLRRENSSLVRFVPELLDEVSWNRSAAFTAHDREALGYDPVEYVGGEPPADWLTNVEATIPAIRAVIERNERIGDLKRLVTRSRAS